MDGNNLKYILFAAAVVLFYLFKRSIDKKLKEAQKKQEESLNQLTGKKEEPAENEDDEYYKMKDDEIQEGAEIVKETEKETADEFAFQEQNDDFHTDEKQFEMREPVKVDRSIDEYTDKDFNHEEKIRTYKYSQILKNETSASFEKETGNIRKTDQDQSMTKTDIKELRKAVIWSEILAPPVSERNDS